MALKLCGTCERHVRESDATCPYCGSEEAAKVPAPAKLNRKAMYFAAVVMTTAAVETASGCAVYGAPIDCEENDCGYVSHCRYRELEPIGTGGLRPSRKCTEESYRSISEACFRGGPGTDCSSTALPLPECARCLIGPRYGEKSNEVSSGALLSYSPLLVNTGACAAVAMGRPDCASYLTQYDFRVAQYCQNCDDPSWHSACRAAQRSAGFGASTIEAKAADECIALRDQGRAEWEPVCVGATPLESLDKVARTLCFGE